MENGLKKEIYSDSSSGYLHSDWKTAKQKNSLFLKNASWITHINPTTLKEEKITGGEYKFVKEFTLPFEKSQIKSATLYILVDDECEIEINGVNFNKKERCEIIGIEELHQYNFIEYLKGKNNRIEFLISNRRSSTRDLEHNSYGFIYCLDIYFIERIEHSIKCEIL